MSLKGFMQTSNLLLKGLFTLYLHVNGHATDLHGQSPDFTVWHSHCNRSLSGIYGRSLTLFFLSASSLTCFKNFSIRDLTMIAILLEKGRIKLNSEAKQKT